MNEIYLAKVERSDAGGFVATVKSYDSEGEKTYYDLICDAETLLDFFAFRRAILNEFLIVFRCESCEQAASPAEAQRVWLDIVGAIIDVARAHEKEDIPL